MFPHDAIGQILEPRGRMLAGVCKNPQVDMDGPAVAELVADVAAAVACEPPQCPRMSMR